MNSHLRNEIVLTATLVVAAMASFSASALCWSGEADLNFIALALMGSAFTVMAFWSLSQCIRTGREEHSVRLPLLGVVKDVFVKEPPIRGKRV